MGTGKNIDAKGIVAPAMRVFICWGKRGKAKKEQKLGTYVSDTPEGAIAWAQSWYDEDYERHPEREHMTVVRAIPTRDR